MLAWAEALLSRKQPAASEVQQFDSRLRRTRQREPNYELSGRGIGLSVADGERRPREGIRQAFDPQGRPLDAGHDRGGGRALGREERGKREFVVELIGPGSRPQVIPHDHSAPVTGCGNF